MKKQSKKVIVGVAAFAAAVTGAATTVAIKRQKAKATPKKEYNHDEERTHFDNDNTNLFI